MSNRFLRPSFAALLLALSTVAQATPQPVEMPAVDIAGALAVDALKKGPQPFRFAVPVAVALAPEHDGEWQQRADGMAVWQLAVHSAHATSLNFGFSQFALPPGAALTVATLDGRDRRGPYTSANHPLPQLWTPIVRSDNALIELTVPAAARSQVQLLLGVVNHGFRGFGAKDATQAKSGSCNIDVVCSDGNDWRNEIRSVARYTISGALLCTGQLVNNTAQDFTPYFLTANHCVTTAAEAPTTVFYWNYQTSKCGGIPDGSLEQTQSGALLRAASGGATEVGPDFTLLQLLSSPDASFKVYYSGWDRRDVAPLGVVGIHHPNGDEKRISMDFDQTFISAYDADPDPSQASIQQTHIMVRSWDRGVTEGGSSGSGIWNRQHHLVGQLSGGGSSCDAPKDPDWYGRVYKDFTNADTPLTSVRTYLDPKNSNVDTLDGADPAATATPAAGGSSGGGATTDPGVVTPAPSGGSMQPAGSSSSDGGGSGGGGAFTAVWLLLAAGLRKRRRVA